MNSDEREIESLLQIYEKALNMSDTEAALSLYAPDGVFMPQHSPSSVGLEAVRQAYEGVFAMITLSVGFKIAEIHQVAPDWAFARTNSAGSVKVKSTGGVSAEGNQELFIFQKLSGVWKIARYCFSTTNPPRL